MTPEPIDDVLKALRDELAAVSPSPEFQTRVRERVSGEFSLLREELAAVAPSPEFAVRVRQGIEEAQAARAASWWRFSNWRLIGPVAAAAAIVALMVMMRPEAPAVAHVTAKVTPAPVIVTPTPQPEKPLVTRPNPRVTPAPVVTTAVATTPVDPFLEVITNQPALLRAERDRIRAAGAVESTQVVVMPNTVPDIVVAPVQVSPIVVQWLVEPPPSPSGGAPVIRRVAADMAERSAK